MSGSQQFPHGRLVLAQSDQGVDDGLAALRCGQGFRKQPLGHAEPPRGPHRPVGGAERHHGRLKRVTVPLRETDLQFVLGRGVAAEAGMAGAVRVRGAASGSLFGQDLVFELAFVPEAAALAFQVELAGFLSLGTAVALASPLPDGAAREEGEVQAHRPDHVGDALAETLSVDGGQGQSFLLPLAQTLIHGDLFRAVGTDRFLTVALAEDLLEEMLQGGSKFAPAGLQRLFAALPVKAVSTRDQ